jgi:hypothetical protein
LKVWLLDYMCGHLQIEESQIAEMCLELYREYGTTMAGLKVQIVFIYCLLLAEPLICFPLIIWLLLLCRH